MLLSESITSHEPNMMLAQQMATGNGHQLTLFRTATGESWGANCQLCYSAVIVTTASIKGHAIINEKCPKE